MPLHPREFKVERGNGQATLKWGPPYYEGSSPVTGYEYHYKTTGSFPDTWTAVADGSDEDTDAANERSVTVTGLTNNVRHTFEFRAVSDAGDGVSTTASVTPNTPPTSADVEVTILEDNAYILRRSDFVFNDADEGDIFVGIEFVSDPAPDAGRMLTLRSGAVMFVPTPNWHGSDYAKMRFRVFDGKDVSTEVYTFTFNVTPVNDPATGRPTISGRRQAGQVMTASTAGIRDIDGLPESFSYQWIRVDVDGKSNPVDISGATASTYTLATDDVGKRIKVRVSFTDDDGYSEQASSYPSGLVQAQGVVNVAPTAADATLVTDEDTDYVFKVSDFGFGDANAGDLLESIRVVTAPGAGALLLDDEELASGAVVRQVDIDAGKLVFRPDPNDNGVAYASFTFKVSDGTAESAPASTITIDVNQVNDPATGKLRIIRDAENRVLQTSAADIDDVDGMSNIRYLYKYTRTLRNGSTITNDSWNHGLYEIDMSTDVGAKFQWSLTFTDDDGNKETVHSDEVILVTAAAAKEAPSVQGEPSVSGPGDDNVWTPGETIEISITFNEAMTVLAYRGMPTMKLMLGTTLTRKARYNRGNSTKTLVFSYTLTKGDGTHNSLLVMPNSLALNGGVIQSRMDRVAASLIHDGVAIAPVEDSKGAGGSSDRGARSVNSPATGMPIINGSPSVGEILTASTAYIRDDDGMADSVFTYQWIRHDPGTSTDTDLEGATTSSYTITDQDKGRAIKVRVTFTDDAGNKESLTSPATSTVNPPLTATAEGVPTSHDGLSAFTFTLKFSQDLTVSYKALRDHAFTVEGGHVVNARRNNTWTDDEWEITVQPDGNDAVTVTLPATTDCAAPGAICTINSKKLSEALEFSVAGPGSQPPATNSAATGVPTISGSLQVGETLTADTSGIADTDGMANATFSHQWLADDVEIESATASSYTLATGDVGKAIKVRVDFTDDAGNPESVTSAATAVVSEPSPPPNRDPKGPGVGKGAPGAPEERDRQQFTARFEGLPEEHDGTTAFNFELHFSEEPPGLSYVTVEEGLLEVAGAEVTHARRLVAGSNLAWEVTVEPAALGEVTIRLPARECSDANAVCVDGERLAQEVSATVGAANSPATGSPTISGMAQVGETLTAGTADISDSDGTNNAVFAYQWLADDAEISGTTGSTYTLTSSELGKAIKVKVTFTDDAGNEESLTSEGTAAVQQPLTATASNAPQSHDGSESFACELRFSEEPADGFSYVTLRDHVFTVTGGTVVKASRLNAPSNIGWKITVTPTANGTVTIVLPATTDCAGDGAVCTDDGKMLSGRLELTVPGPGG